MSHISHSAPPPPHFNGLVNILISSLYLKCVVLKYSIVNIDRICFLVNFLKPILKNQDKKDKIWMIQNKKGNVNFIFLLIMGLGGIFVTSHAGTSFCLHSMKQITFDRLLFASVSWIPPHNTILVNPPPSISNYAWPRPP